MLRTYYLHGIMLDTRGTHIPRFINMISKLQKMIMYWERQSILTKILHAALES